MQIGSVAADAVGAQQRHRARRNDEHRRHHRDSKRTTESIADRSPSHQTQTQQRNREDRQHPSHHPVRNRRVHDAEHHRHCTDHHHNRGDTLQPWSSAEEQPPEEDDETETRAADDGVEEAFLEHERGGDPQQPLEGDSSYTRPKPQRLAFVDDSGVFGGHDGTRLSRRDSCSRSAVRARRSVRST
jgi:hypothetical protein